MSMKIFALSDRQPASLRNALTRPKLPVLMIAAATFQLTGTQAMSQPECDMLRLAREHIAKRFPSFDPTGLEPIISESENLWELTYELPRGTFGGVPIITVDKRTCKVIRAQHSQ